MIIHSSIRRILYTFPIFANIRQYSKHILYIFMQPSPNIRCFARTNGYRSQSSFLFSSIPRWSCRSNRLHICYFRKNTRNVILFFFFRIYQIYQKKKIQKYNKQLFPSFIKCTETKVKNEFA